MKKTLVVILLICTSAILIVAACRNSGSSSHSDESIQQTAKRPLNAPKPKNWPWRGVCIQSAKSDYKDVAYLASVNVNFLRIQLKSAVRARRDKIDPLVAFNLELEWADRILDECKKYNITCIIAFNHLVLDPKKGVDDKSPEFWSNAAYTDSAYNMVDIIAKRYANRGSELSAYEVIGEPAVESFGITSVPSSLNKFYSTVLSRIRKYDQQRYFLLTPGPWGKPTNYKDFEGFDIKDDKLIFGAHMYLPFPYTQQGIKDRPKGVVYPGKVKGYQWNKAALENNCKALEKFASDNNALIYIGEFQAARWSVGCDQWVKDVADILEKNGWAWSYFSFQSDQTFWDPYYDVANPNDSPEKWTLKYTGKESVNWKFMVKDYFSRNIKK